MPKKTTQRKLMEEPKRKGIKIPFYVIVFFVVFSITFISSRFNNDSSSERGDYMSVKYVDNQVREDPFQKPEPETSGGGGMPEYPQDNLSYFFNEVVFGKYFVIFTAIFLAIPIIMVFSRAMRY